MKTLMIMLILLAGGFLALAVLFSPAGKAAVTFITDRLQSAPLTVASINVLNPSEEDFTPPPMKVETALEETKATPAPAPAAPAETGPDDTFERVMAVYEQDGKEQAGEATKSELAGPGIQ